MCGFFHLTAEENALLKSGLIQESFVKILLDNLLRFFRHRRDQKGIAASATYIFGT